MNPTFLALGAVFFAIGGASIAGAAKQPDAGAAKKQRVAAGMFFAAGAAFIVAALMSRPV